MSTKQEKEQEKKPEKALLRIANHLPFLNSFRKDQTEQTKTENTRREDFELREDSWLAYKTHNFYLGAFTMFGRGKQSIASFSFESRFLPKDELRRAYLMSNIALLGSVAATSVYHEVAASASLFVPMLIDHAVFCPWMTMTCVIVAGKILGADF
ncbi:MAG: hypothetical protein KGI04_01440 [Candidatus Micrarchaeota archaeon]|nr:hypothetical protein [Candidatus Micrarchaeota archaeon]